MDAETKNYEIAYLLSSQVSEDEALIYAGKITTMIEDSKGTIRHITEPKKRNLAYPVKKERLAYFGYTTLAIAKSHINDLKKKLTLELKILRYMVVEEEEKSIPFTRLPIFRQPKESVIVTPREAEEKEKLDITQLDKKLEEILGPKL